MATRKSVRDLIVVGLLPLLLAAPLGGVPAAWAAPAEAPSVGCHRLYLPLVVRAPSPVTSSADVQGTTPVAPHNAICAGSPDFNGDGYADLAIGVPNKEVNNGVTDLVDAGLVHVIYGSPTGLIANGLAPVDDQIFHRALAGVSALGGDQYGATLAMGDFNNDGFDDLAVGVPGADISGHADAGAVDIIYGSADGLAVLAIEEWSRGNDGLTGPSAVDEAFGASLATGDFDDDGYADLAVGTPYATVGGDLEAGGIAVLYGRSGGLSDLGNEWLTQDTTGFLASSSEPYDRFGQVLATGDFDGDGTADLAVGTPGENNGDDYIDAGAVQIFFGQSPIADAGLIHFGSVLNPQHWTADSPYVDGAMEPEDGFGASLAAADFDADGYTDLAVGIPNEVHGTGPGALTYGGAINVFEGGAGGLTTSAAHPALLWHQDSTGMQDEVEQAEFFGRALAAADFNNDGYADLAIGVPGDGTLGVAIGATHLMYGTSIGLTANNDDLIYDPEVPALNDSFGWSLTAGDYDGDGFTDLTVGAYRDDPVGVGPANSGSVFSFYSDAGGVAQAVNQNWFAGHNSLKGTPAANDYFGYALPGSTYQP